MTAVKLVLIGVFLIGSSVLCAGETLVWSDEFDGVQIDAQKWHKPEYNRRQNSSGPDGWWLRDDSFLDGNGHLIIRARKIANRNNDNDPYDYATGAIRSIDRFEQRYGKFEIRCRLPQQPGWWVAYWLFSHGVGNVDGSGEDGTEIDIFEGFGWTDKMQHALHWDGYGDAHQSIGHDVKWENLREGFHTFSLEWYENIYLFYVDGIETWRTDAGGVSKVPAYVKVTGELSTESWAINDWWSNDPETATYPDSLIVDYVRVYELDETVSTKPGSKDHIAYRKTAAASSQSETRYSARRATDGSITTRWQSETSSPQWLTIDLTEPYDIHKVMLSWGENFGEDYKIEVAQNTGGPWSECLHVTDNAGRGEVTHEFETQTGRYVRMYGIKSGADAGFSLVEFAVFGEKNTSAIRDDNTVYPEHSILLHSYPNPFNPTTTFRFQTVTDHARLTIHNVSGQVVASLVDENVQPGEHAIVWDAAALTSGIYLARLQTADEVVIRKVILQK